MTKTFKGPWQLVFFLSSLPDPSPNAFQKACRRVSILIWFVHARNITIEQPNHLPEGGSSCILVYTDVPLEWVIFLTSLIYQWVAIFINLSFQWVDDLACHYINGWYLSWNSTSNFAQVATIYKQVTVLIWNIWLGQDFQRKYMNGYGLP
jgi:hypothetical protein